MDKLEAYQLLTSFIQSWSKKDIDLFDSMLSDNIVYSECYGPIYEGINACKRWFSEWNKVGKVLQWDIIDFAFDSVSNKICFEWYFKCEYEGVVSGFYGCSFMKIEENTFVKINEYKTENNHSYPYN